MEFQFFLTPEEREFWLKILVACGQTTLDPEFVPKINPNLVSRIDSSLIDVLRLLNTISPELITTWSCDGHGLEGYIRMRMGTTAYHIFLYEVVPIILTWRGVRVVDHYLPFVNNPDKLLRQTQFSWSSKETSIPVKFADLMRGKLFVPNNLIMPY